MIARTTMQSTIRSLLIVALMVPGSAFASDILDLEVRASGFRVDVGRALVSVYRHAEGFPEVPKKALMTSRAYIHNGNAEVRFVGLPRGRYAIAVVHDENDNGRTDANWLGTPTEGVGTSQNRDTFYGPARFSDSALNLDSREQADVDIQVRY